MALGKISGHMLSSNLIRNNVDLSFETNLLYFSVSDANPTNYKIGINTDSPAYLLDVSGTTRTTNFKSTNVDIGNLNVTNNTLTSIGDLTISAVSNNIILSSNLVSNNKVLIGSSATTTRFPNAKVAISETAAGIQQNENGNIGIVAEAVGAGATRNAGVYGVGYTAGSFTGQGVVGESHVSATGDTAPAVGVRGYANDTHAGGINVGLYGDATNGNANYSLYLNSGDIYSAGAKTWYLNGNLTFNGAYSITIPTLALTNALPVTSGGTGVTTSTGTGNVVLSNNPTLVTPTLGNATATTINKVTITAPANSATLTLIDGKTLTVNNTLSFTGTDASSVSFGTGGTVVYAAAGLSQFTASSTLSSALAAIMSDETGTGLLVFNNAPTFIAPVLGAASATSLTLSNPLPVTSGGTGVTTKTGTGNVVLSSSPSLTTAITTTSTSFDLLDTTATTINFGRAATTITMGSNTSTIHMQHDLQVDGDIYFNGTANQLSATNLSVNDSLIYLAVNNAADILDIGWVGAYNPAGTHLHTGLVRDATDGVWKFYSNIIPEPDTTVDFSNATYDSLQIGKLIGTSALIGSAATSARFPNAKVAISDTAAGLQQSETHNIGLIAEGTAHPTNTGIYGIGVYGVGYTNAATRSGGVVGEGHVSATGDTGSAIGVRGYANDTHAGGMNIGLYADASNSSINNYALYMNSGNITNVAAQTWTLGGNLSFSGAYTVSVPSLTATGVITANTTTNNQTYTTTSTGTITISSGATGNIDNMNIGNTTAAIGKFTTLSASSTVSGTGFSTYLSSPPAIGNTTANTGAFTTLTTTSTATIGSDLTVTGNLTVNGTTTTVNSTTVTVDDKNIELGSVATPTNTTADGGGITLRGATDKTITWDSTNTNWTSSENWNIATGKTYKINNVNVLTSSAVLNDSTQTTVSVGSYATTLNLGASNSGNAFINNNVLYVGGATALSTATAGIEVGGGRTGSGISYIDLTSDTTYADYSARFLRNAGANSNTILSHRGTGNLIIGAVEAGVIEFDTSNTERMRIDSVGNVGIGTTTPNTGFGLSLQLYNNQNTGTVASNSYINVQSVNRNAVVELCSSSTGISALNFSSTVGTTLAGIAGDIANQTLIFRTGGAIERMRIDSVGNVGIGNTPVAGATVSVRKNITGAVNSYGILNYAQIQSDVTTNANIFQSQPSTQAAIFTLGSIRHFYANQDTFGAGSVVTSQIGFAAESSLIGATSNYGFYGGIPVTSGKTCFNLYMGGTADNYLAGNLGIGTTTPVSKLHVLATGASNGTINSRTALHIQNNNVTTGNGNARIQFSFDPATPKAWIEAGVYGTDYLAFGSSAGATESMRIDSSGRVLIGNSTAAGVAGLQLWGIDAAAQQHIRRYSNDAAGASINLFKGRGDATTSAIVQNGDSLGYIGFSGHDGSSTLPTATIITARIEAVVDGVPGTNDMPSRLVFSTTPDGSATITERMRINSSGNVLIGTTTDDTTSKLQVTGTVKATAFIGDATGLTYTGATIRPSLLLDFANSKFLDQGITFTRSSAATYIGYDGLLKIAASGEPRFDHDPVTKESLGLLIEEQRTNLLTYSENFDNAAWTKGNSTITANATTAPDGTFTADKFVENTTSSTHYLGINLSGLTATSYYTYSFYAKAGERTRLTLGSWDGTLGTDWVFNLLTGVVDVAGAVGTASITNVGNGWYRCSAARAIASTILQIFPYLDSATSGAGANNYTGNGTSGLYIWGAQLEVGAFPTSYIPSADSFTSRASTGTFIGSNGLIQSAATNVARYNYNPLNLALSPKLLLEPASTNLLTYSEQFNMWSGWQLNTTTANATTAPDGNATADKIIENSTTNSHNIAQSVNVTSGTTYTVSCYIKAAERFKANLVFWTNNSAFPLTGLTIDLISGAFSVSGNQIAYSVIPHSSGWYRCSITQTASATAAGTLYIGIINDSGVESYTGNGTSGIYVWGAQLETSTSATSYISTTSTTATRSADVSSSAQATRTVDIAVMTGTNFSSWYRQDEGSIFVKSDTVYATPTSPKHTVMFANSIDYSKIVIKNCRPSSLTGYTIWNNSDVVQSELSSATTVAANTMHLIAASYKTNDCAMSTNGATVATNTTAVIPTDVVKLYIGGFTNSEQNGHISKLAYYPKRLSNAELQSITTG